ncbi:MAG: hypothetical protein IJ335_04090 [Lachnospiraceae bacterium]|nr:hypothetical protein [Lachnospiraceae bacterium]
MQDTNVLRMVTLIYSETEGIKKKGTILRKVIEAVFMELDNIELSITELQTKTQDMLRIFVSEDEIYEVLEKGKGKQYFNRSSVYKEIKYNMTAKRYQKLKENSKKNIEESIDSFIVMHEYNITIKEIIYKYLYYLFQRNIEDFSNILGGKMQNDENLEQNFTPEELNIIKKYIEWDNVEKNEAVVTLMGSSLEYSMLVSDNSYLYGTRLGNIFSNKIMYIDTNIIYYCLGINGDAYRIANEMLLDKCQKAKQNLRISKVTEKEFINTLKHYIEEIKRFESISLTKINYQKYIKDKDIYLYYLEWKKKRNRFNTPDYFEKFIITQFNTWLKKYNVAIDKKEPYNTKIEESSETIATYSEEIPYKGTVNYDALNVYWVECLRKKEDNTSFSDEKYFILSPHKNLKKWDIERKPNIPLIIAPELWMVLLTRFISRSDDDYKSFINFINIKGVKDESINNKEFFVIVKAIEEITDDLKQQEEIIDVLVEERFSYLEKELNVDITPEQIYDKTRERAEKELSARVNTLSDEVQLLTTQVKELQEDKVSQACFYSKEQQELLAQEREKGACVYADEKLVQKRCVNALIIAVVTSLVVWQLVDFFGLKNQNNLFWEVVEAAVAQTPFEEQQADFFVSIGGVICLSLVVPADYYLAKIFVSDEAIEQYKRKIKKKFFKKTQNKAND